MICPVEALDGLATTRRSNTPFDDIAITRRYKTTLDGLIYISSLSDFDDNKYSKL